MNKKFTLLAAALMTVGTFTAASAASDVPSKEWTVGNYYGDYIQLYTTTKK